MFCKKGVHRNFAKFTGKPLCQRLFLIKLQTAWSVIKKEHLARVFSCEFCEISKNTFFYRTFPVAASGNKIPKYRRNPTRKPMNKKRSRTYKLMTLLGTGLDRIFNVDLLIKCRWINTNIVVALSRKLFLWNIGTDLSTSLLCK